MTRLADIPEPERTVIADLDCPAYADTPTTIPTTTPARHVAIVSTSGFIVHGQCPMLANESGYQTIAATVADGDILCSHVSTNFDRSGFQRDVNVMLPRDRLQERESEGLIGFAELDACFGTDRSG